MGKFPKGAEACRDLESQVTTEGLESRQHQGGCEVDPGGPCSSGQGYGLADKHVQLSRRLCGLPQPVPELETNQCPAKALTQGPVSLTRCLLTKSR